MRYRIPHKEEAFHRVDVCNYVRVNLYDGAISFALSNLRVEFRQHRLGFCRPREVSKKRDLVGDGNNRRVREFVFVAFERNQAFVACAEAWSER